MLASGLVTAPGLVHGGMLSTLASSGSCAMVMPPIALISAIEAAGT